MGEWALAATAAQTALTTLGKQVADTSVYAALWGARIVPSVESIFEIPFTTATIPGTSGLHAMYCSANGRYGNYKSLVDSFDLRDVRRVKLFDTAIAGSNGTAFYSYKYPWTATAVYNQPVIRASEMALIIAEAEAKQSHLPQAVDALWQVASRNPNLLKATLTNKSQADLLAFIAEERCRELFQEGHRLLDARRRGDILSRNASEAATTYTNLNAGKFVYPIPQLEINASHIEQNSTWIDCKPTR
jgi:hypothetical protein